MPPYPALGAFHWPSLVLLVRTALSRRFFSLRYLFWVSVFVPPNLMLFSVARAMKLLDRILFPGIRLQEVKAPIYILAPPRSGTTLLHRLLESDTQFSCMKLYFTLFPSVLAYRIAGLLKMIDRMTLGLFQLALRLFDHVAFKGWEGIHGIGLNKSEEDEAFFVANLLSPGLFLLFPFIDEIRYMAFVDRFPETYRNRLTEYYRGCIQRHMYAVGRGKTLLAKNSFATGRLGIYMDAFPDMRIINIVRHPCEALPSLLSMFTKPWSLHSPQCYGDTTYMRALAQVIMTYMQQMFRLGRELPSGQYVEVMYDDLLADPMGTVERIYEHFGLEVSNVFRKRLEEQCKHATGYRSRHTYDLDMFGLDAMEIRTELQEIFEYYGFGA